MEKQIYGNITNTARTQFQFDKIYPNRLKMDEYCDKDGIYAGRYVLVEYDDQSLDCYTKLIKKGNLFFFSEFPSVEAIPNTTIMLGQVCYVKNSNGSLSFYEASVRTLVSDGEEKIEYYFKELFKTDESPNPFVYNWNLDYEKYGRGFDSTVWQKIYVDGKEKYIMIAELNTIVPNFTISNDAPEENPVSPHFDEASTYLDYNLHMPTSWGFRVKQASDGDLSDEKTIHTLKYNEDGSEKENPEKIEVDANIYYNKKAFDKFNYREITVSDKENIYEKDKYFYQVNNVYALDKQEEYIDTTKYYKLKDGVEDKKYYSLNDLISVDLKKSDETNWKTGTYYLAETQTYSIATGEFSANKQYYISQKTDYGHVIFTPVSIKETDYEVNKYYESIETYILDNSNEFKDNLIYYEKKEDNYNIITLVDKPVYYSDTYYKFFNIYYIKDSSEVEIPNRIYYEYDADTDQYIKITFEKRTYAAYTYYYKNDEGEYVLDPNPNTTEGRVYYEKFGYGYEEGNNYIIIEPTGTSYKHYNNHLVGKEKSLEVMNDIQEISIRLPVIGNIISEIWNLIYGKLRNDLLYSEPYYNPNMYQEDGITPLYLSNMESLVGALNLMGDLIGHNMIQLDSLNSISIDGKEVLINGNNANFEVNEADRWIYHVINDENESENGYYRAIVTITGIDTYSLELIKMSSIDNNIDSIYETLLEIQKALGTNEDETTASANSLKGALIRLENIIEKMSEGIDFVTVGEGLTMQQEPGWKTIDGIPLGRDYSPEVFTAMLHYTKYEDYYPNQLLTPYEMTGVDKDEVDQSNYMNYWIELQYEEQKLTEEIYNDLSSEDKENLYWYNTNDYIYVKNSFDSLFDKNKSYFTKRSDKETPIWVKAPRYDKNYGEEDESYVYATFEKCSGISQFEAFHFYYTPVLPVYYYYNENGERVYLSDDTNIFEDIIEFTRYNIMHSDPEASKDNDKNKIYGIEQQSDDEGAKFSVIQAIQVNGKGHVYGSQLEVLPQAIVSPNKPENAPIGTLWYDTNSNS